MVVTDQDGAPPAPNAGRRATLPQWKHLARGHRCLEGAPTRAPLGRGRSRGTDAGIVALPARPTGPDRSDGKSDRGGSGVLRFRTPPRSAARTDLRGRNPVEVTRLTSPASRSPSIQLPFGPPRSEESGSAARSVGGDLLGIASVRVVGDRQMPGPVGSGARPRRNALAGRSLHALSRRQLQDPDRGLLIAVNAKGP